MALAEVAVAATDRKRVARARSEKAGAIIAAALALPGVITPGVTRAASAPEQGEIAVKYLHYQDSQPGLKRIKVEAPSIYVMVPLSPKWSVEGSLVNDSVSGATPRYHSSISGATKRMKDERNAQDVKVTRYEDRSTYSLGYSHSKEHDYKSNAVSFDATFSSDDNNRTWNVGAGFADDKIGSTNDPTLRKTKQTVELIAGVTQAVTANDLVQLNLSFNRGHGYYSDPYKDVDARPDHRAQKILLTRWNHYFNDSGATLKASYRFYSDNFGIKAHTLGADWVQPIGDRFTVTPSLRYYTQSHAKFYFDPVYDTDVGAPYPPGYFTNTPRYSSADQRLSAFGAVTVGLKAAFKVTQNWTVDAKVERYEQRAGWRIGRGSPGLDPFRATFVQIGISTRF
ncbi:MAG: hypothetical protein CFE40_05180 [Burkholderiales bacterium PBB1]|nr:MAG: hypothetical protein CFE40_05180 [Burkholderiales bacterium PBB1]